MSRLDWPGLMRAGLAGLRLTPAEFWRLTPVELMLMLGLGGEGAPLTRARLDELARAFPDKGLGDDGPDGLRRPDRGA